MIAAASMDVAGLLAPGSPWQWTIGMSHREYRYSFAGETTHIKGLDFGSSVRYWRRLGNTRLAGSLAGVLRNSDDDVHVPDDTRVGLGLSLEVDGQQMPKLMVLTLAYLFKDIGAEEESFGDRHYGAELTLWQTLSVRFGHDEQMFGGTDQFGIGLTVPRQWIKPFGLSVDWGKAGTGTIRDIGATDEDSFHLVSVTGWYEF